MGRTVTIQSHAFGVAQKDDAAQLGAARVQVERRQRRVDAHVCACSQAPSAFDDNGWSHRETDARSGSILPPRLGRPGLMSQAWRTSACVGGRTSVPVHTDASRGAEVRCGEGGRLSAASRRWRWGQGQQLGQARGERARTSISVEDSLYASP